MLRIVGSRHPQALVLICITGCESHCNVGLGGQAIGQRRKERTRLLRIEHDADCLVFVSWTLPSQQAFHKAAASSTPSCNAGEVRELTRERAKICMRMQTGSNVILFRVGQGEISGNF